MVLEKITRRILTVGLFLYPLFPLIVSDLFYFPFVAPRAFAFRFITTILFFLWIALILKCRDLRPKFTLLKTVLFVFVGIITLADIFGVDTYRSIWSGYERMEGLITLLYLLAYFILASSLFDKRKWMYFWQTSLAVSLLLCTWELARWIFNFVPNDFRLQSVFGNPAYFSSYIIFHIFFALFLLRLPEKSFKRFWIFGGAAIVQIFTLLLTGTRGAVLALLGGTAVLGLLFVWRSRKSLLAQISKRRLAAATGAAIILLVLIFGAIGTLRLPAFSRFSNLSFDRISAEPRVLVWQLSWEAFKERPILGWGQENFVSAFNSFYDPRLSLEERWFDRAHNFVFDWLVAGGILGLLAYIAIFFAALFSIWRSLNFSFFQKNILTGLLVAYLINNFFVFDSLSTYILFFSLLAFVDVRKEEVPIKNTRTSFGYLFTGSIVLALFVFYFVNVPALQKNIFFYNGLSPHTEKREENLKYFKKALAIKSFDAQEVGRDLSGYAIALTTGDSEVSNAAFAPSGTKKEIFEISADHLAEQIKKRPNSFENYLYMGNLLKAFGSEKEAIVYYEKAGDLALRRKEPLYNLGEIYMKLGDYENSTKYFKLNYELESLFDAKNGRYTYYVDQSLRKYIVSLILSGNFPEAENLITDRFGDPLWTDPEIINAYVVAKKYDKVLELWQKKVRQEPNKLQNKYSLVAAYIKMGRTAEAIALLLDVSREHPELKTSISDTIYKIKTGTLKLE